MNKWKRTIIGGIAGILLVVSASFALVAWEMPWDKASAAGVVSSSGVFTIPAGTGTLDSATLGTSTNPFVVLEIVPNENMAQFGYLVDGQEPINLYAAMTSSDRTAVSSALSTYMTVNMGSNTVVKTEFITDISNQEWTAYYWNYYINANQYGYYEKLPDKTGSYDLSLTLKSVADPATGGTKTVYEYKITGVPAGTGSYQWVGYSYADSSLADTSAYQNGVTSDSALNAGSEALAKIYGYQENIAAYNAYSGTKVNKELFKKYALGLAYKDGDIHKGEDSAAYEFLGWYLEPECVNPYNKSTGTISNITLYAKWKTIYSSDSVNLYSVSFNGNAGTDTVQKLPANVEFLNSGDAIVEPKAIPLRKGFIFTGWYKDAACTAKYDFTKKIIENTTVYAGWEGLSEHTYILHFNANTGAGNVGTVSNMPGDITGVLQNGRTEDFMEIKPVTEPSREGYLFAGWYWNAAGTNSFQFDEPIPVGVTSDTIQLYARWIAVSSAPAYKITFNGNKPSGAISSVKGMPKTVTGIAYGKNLDTSFPEDTPVLEGNITEKLKNYQVQVITVTPRDFTSQASNLGLIDRADLIVLNETCENQLKTFWTRYKNTELFSKPSGMYDLAATKFTDSSTSISNDLSWAATLRLMNKITGTGGVKMCPVIFDYAIYRSAIASSAYKTDVNFISDFSDSSSFNINAESGYSSNVYKLYLMTQQFNPITLYNAYIATNKFDANGNFTGIASTYTNARKYWNNFTLLPYSVISSSDWNSTTKTFASNALEVIGINRNYTVPSGKGLIHNRVFLYQSSSSMVAGFLVPQLLSADHGDMNTYFYGSSSTLPERYTTAEGMYYMLHNSKLYQNFSKSLSILEVEPSDSFKNSSFWFWYISRYVPNFTGSYSVVTKNSSEFIGDIDDLNSQYDVIYLGGNSGSLVTSLMPNSLENRTAAANTEITIGTEQVISSAFQRKEQIPHETTAYQVRSNSASGYSLVNGSGKSVVDFSSGNPVITYGNIGEDKSWLDLEVNYTISTSSNNRNYSYDYYDSRHVQQRVYLRAITVSSDDYTAIGSKFEENVNGNIYNWNTGKWGYIVLKNYYLKTTVNTTYTTGWVNYPAGSRVAAGDVIRFPSGGTYNYTSGSYYRYAHVGARATSRATRRGSFDHVNDDIDYYNYSGNDLTQAKMDDMLEFARAGYPIILSNELLNSSGGIDTTVIDKASNVYNLLSALMNNVVYTPSCFKETDTTRDNEFVNALNNKSFRLTVMEKPVEYVDRTKSAYAAYTDDRVYINGAADGSNSNIEEKNMEFTIKIDTANTGYYEVRLYIDTNADGKFDATEEKLDSLEIENTVTHKSTRVNRLVGGQSYHIIRHIQDYIGAIPWKLEIVDVNHPLIRDDITGQCAIKVTAKTKLKVLQIISDGIGGSYDPTVYFPTQGEIALAKSKNSNKEITDSGVNINTYFTNCIKFVNSSSTYVSDSNVIANAGWFYYYTKRLSEFEVDFYRLSVTEFSTLASTGAAPGESTVYMQNGKCTYFKEKGINMLILGYADCYTDITNRAALTLIENFINAGNTTLFTHDTTSFVNLSSKPASFSDVYWGYNINQYFRKLLGMDRFGVMDNMGRLADVASAPDKPYLVNTLQSEHAYYTASSTAVGTRVLTQGMTNVTVGQNGDRVTSATKANNGQIVSYPYLIPDNLNVASTHSQYYQLDMEADDIVVWYCLDGSSNYYKTDNDVRNNYYIYNRGNITYSGVGHSGGLSDDERKLFVNTMIAAYNAGTVPTEPLITNKDKSSSDDTSDYLYVDYDATLEVGEAQPFGNEIFSYRDGADTIYTKRVFFTLKNYSIIQNKKMTVHYYPVLTSTGPSGEQRTVLTEYPLDLQTYDYDSDTDTGTAVTSDTFLYNQTYSDGTVHSVDLSGGRVQSTYEYYVDIPISDAYYKKLIAGTSDSLEHFALDSNSKFEVQIQVVMRYGREDADNIPLVGIRNAILMKRGMFNLD